MIWVYLTGCLWLQEVAGVADGLGVCRQEALAVERAASDAEARLEELGEAHSTLERSAEAAMDALEEDLAGVISQMILS
jgi:hypothetical protein